MSFLVVFLMDYVQKFDKYRKKGWKLVEEDNEFYISSKFGLKYPLAGDFKEMVVYYTEFDHNIGIEEAKAKEMVDFLKKCNKKSLRELVKSCEKVNVLE